MPLTVIVASRVTAPSAGAVTLSTGAWVSRITVRVESVCSPAPSIAVTVSRLLPSAGSGTVAEYAVLLVTVAAVPLTVTLTEVWS